MIGLIMSAHGQYASGLKTGLDLVVGSSENIKVLDFAGDEIDKYRQDFETLIKEMLEKYDSLAIATDIAGGTPYKTAVMLTSDNAKVSVFSGLNFQLAYELSNMENNLDENNEKSIEVAREGISYFKIENDADTSFEGGIWN